VQFGLGNRFGVQPPVAGDAARRPRDRDAVQEYEDENGTVIWRQHAYAIGR
jgi:hypothetical protein